MLAAAPGVAPRLSVETPFRRCVEQVPEGGTIVRAHCPAPRGATAVPAALAGLDPRSDDPRTIQALALLELVADDPRGIRLDRSISSLRRAAELADSPAPALVDLSAALIVRAERTQAPRDLLEAYETAQKAADREPHNPAALYNRALALDRFGLVEETAEDWKAALAADSTSGWAGEARRRLRALQAIHAPVPPADNAPLADYARYAAEEPQGARELGMDKLLPAWGDATLRGDRPRADGRLRSAEALSAGLLRRPGGDASLADMVRAIRAVAADTAAARRLAAAHAAYGEARSRFENARYAEAQPYLESAVAKAGGSPALQGWAKTYLGMAHAYNGRRPLGMRLLGEAAATADSLRHPALGARNRLALATLLQRAERWERGLDEATRGTTLSRSAGERQSVAGGLSIIADARLVLGEPDSGYASYRQALEALRPFRASVRLHNALLTTARTTYGDGLGAAALRLQDEDVAVAGRIGPPIYVAEAGIQRARFRAGLGLGAGARAELASLRTLVESIEEPAARDWAASELREAEALAVLDTEPARQAATLDTAAGYFSHIELPLRALPNLVGAAEAHLRAGNRAAAAQRLDAVFHLLDRRRDSIRVEPRRAAVFDAARRVVDQLVGIELARGDTVSALLHLDRSRASLAPAGAPESAAAGAASRSGEVAVEYALIADTVLAWTVAGSRVHVARTWVDTTRLIRTIRTVGAQMESGATEGEMRAGFAVLYDVLIRPVAERIGGEGTPLVLVADGVLATVPYAALYDARRQRYLVETHPLRFAVSLRETIRPAAPRSPGKPLFVANPAFDRAEFPLLEPLPRAAEEVRASTLYPGAVVLSGPAATARAFQRALPFAGFVHFAGHAVFDDARPERSHLVFANPPDGREPHWLTAADLARADHRNVQLVVLSACRSVRGSHVRAGGYSGLTGALLASGVGGTIASPWDVDDRSTSILMTAFHREYRRSGNPTLSLRAGQLALFRGGDPRLISPAAWAGFRYTGR